MSETGIIILAAGSSSRFGGIKQLLFYQDKTFIQHIIDEAAKASLSPVIVVTGANENVISHNIHQPVTIVFNKHWQDGMATGIVSGITKILSANKNIQQIIIAVCDQPFVTAGVLEKLIKYQTETNKNIVGCAYANTIGTPVLFTKKYFDILLNLTGDEGAKKLLKIHADDVASISFPQGKIDIDTKDDYQNLLNS